MRDFHLLPERLPLSQFCSDEEYVFMLPYVVDGDDIRMIECRRQVCFSDKAFDCRMILSPSGGENFDRDVAFEPAIAGVMHLANPARPSRREKGAMV